VLADKGYHGAREHIRTGQLAKAIHVLQSREIGG
jgi:hypothetical protein